MNKLPKVSEHQLQTLLMNYLQAKGWYVQRMNSGAVRTDKGHMVKLGETGTPDLMCFKKFLAIKSDFTPDEYIAKILFIEVKTPQNPKPTFAQEQKMKELTEHGARCVVIHSLGELEEAL